MAQLNLGSRKIRCLSFAHGGIYFAASLPGVEEFRSQAKAFKGQKRFDHKVESFGETTSVGST